MNLLDECDNIDGRYKHQSVILTNTQKEADFCAKTINQIYENTNIASTTQNFHNKSDSDINFRILVVCGYCIEYCDKKNVSVVCFLRNIQHIASMVLFTQFVRQCTRRFDVNDMDTSYVISHVSFKQYNA